MIDLDIKELIHFHLVELVPDFVQLLPAFLITVLEVVDNGLLAAFEEFLGAEDRVVI